MRNPPAPKLTISDPVQIKSGRWKVYIQPSDTLALKHRRYGDSPREALMRAHIFMHGYLNGFYKSRAAHHARRAGKIRFDLKRASGADLAGEVA